MERKEPMTKRMRLQSVVDDFTDVLVGGTNMTPDQVLQVAAELNIQEILSRETIPDLGNCDLGLEWRPDSPFTLEGIPLPFQHNFDGTEEAEMGHNGDEQEQPPHSLGLQSQTLASREEERQDLSVDLIWKELNEKYPELYKSLSEEVANGTLGHHESTSTTANPVSQDVDEPVVLKEIVNKWNSISDKDDGGYEPEVLKEIPYNNKWSAFSDDDGGYEPEVLKEIPYNNKWSAFSDDDGGYEPEVLKEVPNNNKWSAFSDDDDGYEPELLKEIPINPCSSGDEDDTPFLCTLRGCRSCNVTSARPDTPQSLGTFAPTHAARSYPFKILRE